MIELLKLFILHTFSVLMNVKNLVRITEHLKKVSKVGIQIGVYPA
jgi:hypothetical protein